MMTAIALLSILVGFGHAQGSRNLARNSDFERAFSQPADGWRTGSPMAGVLSERRESKGLEGGACHVIEAAPEAPVNWYVCSQTVSGCKARGEYVLSGYVRTQDVRDGAGAYMGMNYLDGTGKRISWTDTERKVTGTSDWVRLVQPFTVPPTAVRVDLNLVLHGHGTAFFDRVQVELGQAVTDWVSREATGGPGALPPGIEFRPQEKGNIAILRDSLPATGTASDPTHLRSLVEKTGYGCAFLSAEAMADPNVLTFGRFDVLVLPYGASFPAAAAESLRSFCREGGSLFVFGGYPFDRLLGQQGEEWKDVADLTPDESKLQTLFGLADGPQGWSVGGRDVPGGPAPAGEGRHGKSLKLATESLSGWVTSGSPSVNGLPQDSQLTAFWARADQEDVVLAMEWGEKDYSRWRTKFTLTRDWRLYAAPHAELEYWHDNPSVGRGGPQDRFHPENAVQLRFGLTGEFLRERQPYTVYVDQVLVGQDPFPSYRNVQLNSHHGESNPATFLEPPADAISICDASAPLTGVARLAASPGQVVLPATWRMDGAAEGVSATGQTAQGRAGAPLKARWVPLADALDRYGRVRGTAVGIMHNFAGEYPGSSWAYSGISNLDLFAAGQASGAQLFGAVLERLIDGGFLFDGVAEPRCVRRGETASLRVRAANLAKQRRDCAVTLTVRSGERTLHTESPPLIIAGRSAAPVEMRWPVPQEASGLLTLTWELRAGERVLDRLEAGMVVWDEAQVAAGPRLTYDRCYLSRDRGPEFLLGTQIYWGNSTVTGTDPLRWDRQFARMADSGIKIARSFQGMGWAGTGEGSWRPRDAMVQLAQARGISLFYEGVSRPTTDPTEVTERARIANEAAGRYRKSPGWFIDIVNEPSLLVGGGESDTPEFRAWLKGRYLIFEALREAWGADLTEGSLDEVQIKPATGDWASVRAVDTTRFMAWKMRTWTAETARAAHEADPERLVSVGHLQGFGDLHTMWDPVEASYDMDFANRHYYGDPWQYGPELKQIDMRALGKAPSTGEFGNTSHPGLRTHWVYAPEDVVDWHYAYTAHTCFGLGGAFCGNWHWQDPIEDIFPCGLLLQDGAPRPRFYTYRNAGVLFRQIRPRYEPPEVFFIIPTSHMLGSSKAAVQGAMNRSLATLIGLHVEFGTLAEDRLSALPPSAKAIIWPVPYCPDEASYKAVLDFVRRGGALYLSGDVSYDPMRRRSQTQRLSDLCGLEFVSQRYPDIRRSEAPASEVAPASASPLAQAVCADGTSAPCIEVRATSAEVLAKAGNAPAATLAHIGQGRVLYVVDPIELKLEPRNTLAAFLQEAGVKRHALQPDLAEVHSHRVPGEGGALAQVLFNLSDVKQTVTITDLPAPVEVDLAPKSGGAAIFDGSGKLVAAEGVAMTVGGRELFGGDATVALISLSGDDLRTADGFLLLPSRPGEVALSGAQFAGRSAGIGEVRDGKWIEYERRRPTAAAGVARMALDAAMAHSWIVLGDEGKLSELAERVRREHL
ncbi:MAG: hypothetical protein FJX75_06495 [Armatimonadetes bacterium]|nr:hypothetical protein [Armatimonadota bacterium]